MEKRIVKLNGQKYDLNKLLKVMDPEIAEDVHERINDIEPCTDQEFADFYCILHKEKYGYAFEMQLDKSLK